MGPRVAVGVDGCRAGWFAVALPMEGQPNFAIFTTIDRLWDTWGAQMARLFIDIPIGLPSTAPRRCDREARRLLPTGRKSSVFPVPCRQAVELSVTPTAYPLACEKNRAALGRGLSRQAWNICPKIREVDRFLARVTAARAVVRESHPEVVFAGLNGGRAMEWGKKTAMGREERLAVLRRRIRGADSMYEAALDRYSRRELAPDDVLDAMALAVAAHLPVTAHASLPAEPECDAVGLPMEIVLPRE